MTKEDIVIGTHVLYSVQLEDKTTHTIKSVITSRPHTDRLGYITCRILGVDGMVSIHSLKEINSEEQKPKRRIIVKEINDPFVNDYLYNVAQYFGTTNVEIKGKSRISEIVDIRHSCIYILSVFKPKSLIYYGGCFGQRDHTTIIHARQRIRERCMGKIKDKKTIKVYEKCLEIYQSIIKDAKDEIV